MAIEITITVRTTNHSDDTVITKTWDTGASNPAMDGSIVRKQGNALAEHIAGQLDKLVKQPLVDTLYGTAKD